MAQNEFGQPAGEDIAGWQPARRPDAPKLTGRTVRLEPLAVEHTAALFRSLQSAPAGHWTYMPWGPFADEADYHGWVEASVAADDIKYLTICSPAGEPQGVAGYMNIVPSMGTIEVGGITFAPVLQRSLAATEAMYLMMAHAFDDLGYRRYEWKCDSLNAPSRAAAERLGFRYEGTFAQHRVVRNRNRDTAWFSITDGQWQDLVGPALRAWLDPSNVDGNGQQRRRLQDIRRELS